MGSTPVAERTSTASGVCATSSRLLTWAPNAVFRRMPLAWPATILICSISRFDTAPLAGGRDGRHRVTEAGSQEGREDLHRHGEEGGPPEALSRAGPRVEHSRRDRGSRPEHGRAEDAGPRRRPRPLARSSLPPPSAGEGPDSGAGPRGAVS